MEAARSEAHAQRNEHTRTTFTKLEQAMFLPPTSKTISTKAEEFKVPHTTETVPEGQGAKLHWLGDSSANKVLLYFHGGGYALPPVDGHPMFLFETAKRFRSATKQTLLIAFLEYSLSGTGKFPLQLTQATAALRLLLQKGYKPSDIVVGGDSAGGNMSLGLVSQILHPYPGIPPLHLDQPLAGVLLISPWISFDESTTSYKENQTTDICGPTLLREMVESFVTPELRNPWSEALLAEPNHWKGFPAVKVLNLWGGAEMLRDAVSELGEKLVQGQVNVRNVECPSHVHVDCVLDASSGLEYGIMATEIWDWMASVFTAQSS